MKRTYEKDNRPVTSAKPTTLNLQTRPFAPIQSDESQVNETAEGKSIQAKGFSSENILAKLISTPKTESSATPIRRKAFPSMRMPIQAKLSIGEPNDKYEKEADNTAAKVVQQINSSPQDNSVQKQEGEEDSLQMKPAISSIQREEAMEDEELQMKSLVQRRENIGGGKASEDLESSIQSSRGRGQSLDTNLQAKMGEAMGADFSDVKVHTDSQSDQLNKSIQAKAFTTGQDVFFRQGAYEPSSRGGQELIAHELTHTIQQGMSKGLARKASIGVDHLGGYGQPANLRSKTETLAVTDLSGIIMRKNIGLKDLGGTLSVKANHNKSTFSEIQNFLKSYEAAKTESDELKNLQILEMLVNEWIAKHGSGKTANQKIKVESLQKLLPKIHAEIANLGNEQQSQYNKKIANTDMEISGVGKTSSEGSFSGITESGARGAVTTGAKFASARENAAPAGLTDAELAAIRIYTGGDYKYMTPILNKNEGWLDNAAKDLSGVTAKKETRWANPNTSRSLTKEKGKLTQNQKRVLQIEAMQHARVAMAGLQKRKDVPPTNGFRGFTITKNQLDLEYKTDNVIVWNSFSSCSTNEIVSTSYATQPDEGKVGLLLTINIKYGKDIAKYSQEAGEKEVLVLPGAKFKVKGTPTTTDNKLYKVTLEQTDPGSLAGVPPNIKPKVADQADGLVAPETKISQGAAPARPAVKLTEEQMLQNAAARAAKELISIATDDANGVTITLRQIANEFRGTLEGLDHRLKTEDSLTRKLADRAKTRLNKDPSLTLEKLIKEEADNMNDVLRFTLNLPDNTYNDAYRAMQNKMQAAFYAVVPTKEWNGWTDKSGLYKGINMTFKTNKGRLFEVQLHTTDSLKAKEETHPMYEEKRNKNTTHKRKLELETKMKNRWAKVPVPKGIKA